VMRSQISSHNPLMDVCSGSTAGIVLSSAFLFTVVYNASGHLFSRLSATYRGLPLKLQLRWNNRVTSTLHAALIAPCCLHAFLLAHDPDHLASLSSRIFGCNPEAAFLASISAGYFTWDTLTYLTYLLINRTGDVEVSEFVHSFVCWMAYLITLRPFVLYYGMFFLAFELSTPFVNFHWFMDKLRISNESPVKLINGILVVVLFFGARIVFGFYYSYKVVQDLYIVLSDNLATNGPWGVNVSSVTITLILLTMCILNANWFLLIIKFILKPPRAKIVTE